jgi:hypothetical protein
MKQCFLLRAPAVSLCAGAITCYISEAAATAPDPKGQTMPPSLQHYKVVTTVSADRCLPRATAAGFNLRYIRVIDTSATFAGDGLVGWEFSSLQEAENFATYLRCPLPNFLVSLQKDDSKVKDSILGCIPMPDMSQPWTNQRLQQQFGFTEAEVQHMQHRVSGVQHHVTDAAGSAEASSGSLQSFTTQHGSAFKVGQWVNIPKRVQQNRTSRTARSGTNSTAGRARRQRRHRAGSIPGKYSKLLKQLCSHVC